MGMRKTIEVDFEVHKMIEMERKGFEEPENDALRRLLQLPEREAVVDRADTTPSSAVNGPRAWLGGGVELPHGTALKMDYRGQAIVGRIDNGEWLVDGVRYSSPSAAAGSSVRTKGGGPTSLNGWNYWEVKRPGDHAWTTLYELRLQTSHP